MNNYDFPISIVPIKADDLLIPKKAAVIRTDKNEPLGIVSNQYGLLKHEDVINNLRESFTGMKFEEKIELAKNGAHLFATYKLPSIQEEVKPNDFVSMQIVAKNSYDGTKSFSLMLGAFRLVCSNGMVIGKEIFSFQQRHLVSIVSLSNEILKTKISELVTHFKDSIPLMKSMTKTHLNTAPDGLFDVEKMKLPKYLVQDARSFYEKEDEGTLWNFYNSMTYAISHNLKKDNPIVRIDYAKRAWSIASQMLPIIT